MIIQRGRRPVPFEVGEQEAASALPRLDHKLGG